MLEFKHIIFIKQIDYWHSSLVQRFPTIIKLKIRFIYWFGKWFIQTLDYVSLSTLEGPWQTLICFKMHTYFTNKFTNVSNLLGVMTNGRLVYLFHLTCNLIIILIQSINLLREWHGNVQNEWCNLLAK
jgi:hypothetical protein